MEYGDRAATLFPGDFDKQAGYTALTTVFDVMMGKQIPGVKKEFNQEITGAANNPTIWKVKLLTLTTDKFIYTVHIEEHPQ